MKTIEAQLVISAQDQTAEALGTVRQKISQVQEAVERFRAASARFSEARSNFRAAQTAVEQAATAMRKAAAPTRELQAAYEQAQRAVKAASAAFEAQKAAVLIAKGGLESYGVGLNQITGAQERLRLATQQADSAMASQQARLQRWAKVKEVASNITMFAGPGLLGASKDAVAAGAKYQHELAFEYPAAGISEQETGWASDQASALATRYPIVSSADLLKLYRETRAVISGEVPGGANMTPEERLAVTARDTQRVFPFIVRADAALKASGVSGDDLPMLVKGLEALGITQNVERTKKILDAYVRAAQVAGKTLPIESVLRSIQQMMGVGGELSDSFLMHSFLSLVQEGGSRVGAGIGAMDMTFLGKLGNKEAAEWQRLGFLSDDDLIRTKTGAVKGLKPDHNIKDYQLALSDPDKFLWEKVLPALKAKGYTTVESQIEEVAKLYGQARARRIAAALVQQEVTYEQAAAKFDAALGMAAADIAAKSATAALGELTTALSTFAAALTSPAMHDAAKVMDTVAHGLTAAAQSYGNFAKQNPRTAETFGAGALAAAIYYGGKWTLGLVSGLLSGGAAEGAKKVATTAVKGGAIGTGIVIGAAAGGLEQFVKNPAGAVGLAPFYGAPSAKGEIGELFGGGRAAEVKGSAELNVNVQVEPSDSFISRIVSALRNEINAFGGGGGSTPGRGVGTDGSTGLSMPEAVPPR